MRKIQKKQILDFTALLEEAHEELKKVTGMKQYAEAADILSQCQQGALQIGELIEQEEGEGVPTISCLENYCELVFQVHESICQGGDVNPNRIYKNLRKSLINIENSVKNDIKIRLEMVFLPYKASMWDSLESVWEAADADPDCDAYVVPIPYYDRNPDGSLGKYHYEGGELPSYVPVTHYEEYSFENRRPDAVYIHNPYDNTNYVTTIDPRFYSGELKKYTDLLVYIPYYSTTGGMAESQALCPAYYNADYIVIQAPKYRKFFDARLPDEKFLAFGSPKFDSIIHKCQNPMEPPEEWQRKMAGKKVYFYNTSINGMLGNTEVFLKKMEYVFDIFRGREDACLLWRPHPLLESTFDSMRKGYWPAYEDLKKRFIEEDIGILDLTPDIESTIALCDAYIGDSGTSVTSLFGVAGKPLFIFNNNINTLPEEDDWRGEKINCPSFDIWGRARYQVTRNNQLWFSENDDFHYKFYMDLGIGYSGGGYYTNAVEIKNKIYIIPGNARNLLIIENKNIRKIALKKQFEQGGAFSGCWYNEKYLFVLPFRNPQLIRFNLETEEIRYINGVQKFWVRNAGGEWRRGGVAIYGNELVFASPEDNQFLFMDIDTLNLRSVSSNSESNLGAHSIMPDGEELWLMPLNGMVITCWNPKTGKVREYGKLPHNFKSLKQPYGYECEERPFGNIAIAREGGKENIVISAHWGNMFISLDRATGEMKKWDLPMPVTDGRKNGYFISGSMGWFVIPLPRRGKADCLLWNLPERKLYEININTKEYKEVPIVFDYDDLKEHEPGFMEESEWMQYCLIENAFNSLKNLLDGDITGNLFDKERQLKAYARINANIDGTCGRNVYEFVKGNIQ